MRKVLVAIVMVAVALVVAFPLFASPTQEVKSTQTDWITAKDISQMPQTTIRFWFEESPAGTELGKAQIAQFMKLHPNITVVGSTAPANTDNEMLLPYIKTHNQSHVHQSVNNEDLWYIDHKILFPVDKFPDYKQVLDRFLPQFNYTWKDGHVYSISWYFSPMLLYYNTKLVTDAGLDPNNPPKTYSEFYKWAAALTKKDAKGDVVQWAIAPWMGEDWWYWEFMDYPFFYNATGNNDYISKDGTKVTIDSPMGRAVFDFWQTMFKNGYAAKTSFQNNPFINNQVAIGLEGPWNVQTIDNDAPKGFQYFLALPPKPDNSTVTTPRTWSLVRNLALIPDVDLTPEETARTMRAAWELEKFLLSDEQEAAWYKATANIPAVKTINTDPLFTAITKSYGEKMSQVIQLGLNSYIDGMDSVKSVDVMKFLQDAFLNIAYGKMTADQAVASAADQANKLLAQQ